MWTKYVSHTPTKAPLTQGLLISRSLQCLSIFFLSYISIFHLINQSLTPLSLNPWYIYSVHRLVPEETQALRSRAEPGFIDSGVNYRQHINFVVLDYRKKGERKGQEKNTN